MNYYINLASGRSYRFPSGEARFWASLCDEHRIGSVYEQGKGLPISARSIPAKRPQGRSQGAACGVVQAKGLRGLCAGFNVRKWVNLLGARYA